MTDLSMPDSRRNKNKQNTPHTLPPDHKIKPDPRFHGPRNQRRQGRDEHTHSRPAAPPSPKQPKPGAVAQAPPKRPRGCEPKDTAE